MVLGYDETDRIVGYVCRLVGGASGLPVKLNLDSTNGSYQSGLYNDSRDYIVIGAKALDIGSSSGSVSCVDCLSMCKQALHEYRHFQQKQMFMGRAYDPAEYGFLNLSFGDGDMCRTMARQRLIAAEFPAYQVANQFVLSYERDAEEYAIRAVPAVLKSVGFPEDLIEPCLVQEINRRFDWYGDRPVMSSLKAADDSHVKKHGSPAAKLPLDYGRPGRRNVADTFLDDAAAKQAYEKLSPEDGDRFLVDYIARHDPKAFDVYRIIRDEMPELSAYEKLQRRMYRYSHDVPDGNMYDDFDY